MELLREVFLPSESKLIVERQSNGDLFLSGIFCQGNVKNKNERTYDLQNLSSQVASLQERIQHGESIFGELDHPDTLQINLDRVAIGLVSLQMQGNNGIGKAKVLPTPMGNICRAILESGFKLGVSTRGVGTPINGMINDFQLHTVDVVANPSAPEAYPNAIMEGVNNHAQINYLADAARYDQRAQEFLNKEILSYIKSILK